MTPRRAWAPFVLVPIVATVVSVLIGLQAGGAASTAADKLAAGDAPGAALPLEQPGPMGPTSSTLYNQGLIFHAQGDNARALGAWRAAWELEPSAGDIAHNLAVARRAFPDAPAPAPPPTLATSLLPASAQALLALFAWMAAALTTRRWKAGELGPWLAASVSLGAAALSALWLHSAATSRGSVPAVVVLDAPLRDTPDVQDAVRRTLPPGAELRVDAWRAGFAHVHDGAEHQGWVVDTALYLPVPPGWWGR